MKKVVVLDAGTGNVRSAVRALEYAGADVELTADMDAVMNADGLIVPGVGAFGAVMDKLRKVRADRMIDRRLAGGRAVFGICVGLQVMFDSSVENGHHEGLAQWPGQIERLPTAVVPHMGWTPVQAAPGSVILDGLDGERFYFVHSYGALTDPSEEMTDGHDLFIKPKVSFAEHESARFVAAVENGPLTATQFHPEKSADAGAQVLKNWLATL